MSAGAERVTSAASRAAMLLAASLSLAAAPAGAATPVRSTVNGPPPWLHCYTPRAPRQVKNKAGKLVWRCIKLKVD